MKEVKINIPEGYTIDKENSTFECIKFKKNKFPRTWEEFCNNYPIKEGEFFIDSGSEIQESTEGKRDSVEDAIILPNEKYAEAVLALCQLIQLRDCYNDGWQPDWKTFETKYCIYIELDKVRLSVAYGISYLLTFKTQKIRDEFYNNFIDIIEKAKILL